MKYAISVIVPTYKPQEYFWECLDSLDRQDFQKDRYEVIIVLNGLIEPFNKRIDEYINLHPDVNWRFIRTEIPGVSNARNLALENMQGDYVTFIDDDDFVSPSYLSELYNDANEDTVSLCYPLSFIDGETKYTPYHITNDYLQNEGKNHLSVYDTKKFFSGPVYKLLSRKILADTRFDHRLRNGEDTLFMFAISKRIKEVRLTSRNAIYYRRIREGSAAQSRRSFFEKFYSNTIQIAEYFRLYIKHPLQYNFRFFATRIIGAMVGIVR